MKTKARERPPNLARLLLRLSKRHIRRTAATLFRAGLRVNSSPNHGEWIAYRSRRVEPIRAAAATWPEAARAVSSSNGARRARRSGDVQRLVGPEMLMAAMARPSAPIIGAPTVRSPR